MVVRAVPPFFRGRAPPIVTKNKARTDVCGAENVYFCVMKDFVSTVRDFCLRYGLLPEPMSAPVTVGLSGGADSVALVCVLVRMGHSVEARHCNFGLRGAESDRDEQFCHDLCARLGVPLAVRRFDVGARRRATGESVEMACRELRYGWWREEGVETLAVAHHSDDNVETLMLNLMRGSGIAGLKGMMPRNGNVVRPLLCVSRADILGFLADCGVGYVTDSTNASSEYTRNRIRNRLVPRIESLFPGGVEGIKRSLECLRDNYTAYRGLVERWEGLYVSPVDGSVDVEALVRGESNPECALFELLNPRGLGMAECREMLRGDLTGRRFGAYLLDHGRLYRREAPVDEGGDVVSLSDYPFRLETVAPDEFRRSAKPRHILWADASILDGDPEFVLRPWMQGDRLAPYGMKGTRLASDIYSDARLGEARRRAFPVLLRDGVPVWICGLRASRHFAVTPATRSVVRLTYLPLAPQSSE